jgi:predicted ribonuclease YlaK
VGWLVGGVAGHEQHLSVLTAQDLDGHAMVNGDTIVDVLLDEPGHVRLPNNDDEIVARACYLQQAIAPAPVTVITGDNGMRARALSWGLKARILDDKYKIERLGAVESGQRAGHHVRHARTRGRIGEGSGRGLSRWTRRAIALRPPGRRLPCAWRA